MDNRITKRRFNEFISYNWIKIIIVTAIVIIAWQVLYAFGSVRITIGQEFKYYLDENISVDKNDTIYEMTKASMSYDVLKFNSESIMSSNNLLSARLGTQEGDIVITDFKDEELEEGQTYAKCRAKTIIDYQQVYDLDKLYEDGCEYLKQFLKDGETDYFNFDNLSTEKINQNFVKRMKKDNRYRCGEISLDDELERIKQLCKDIKDFGVIVNYEGDIFYKYHRFEQAVNTATIQYLKDDYQGYYDRTTEKKYGIVLANLPTNSDKYQATEYFFLKDGLDGSQVVIMAFDFLEYQPDLQFETISFIDTIVRNFSTILD